MSRGAHGLLSQKWLAKNAKRRKLMSKQQRTLEDLRDTFEMYDVDGSGGIELEELTLMTRELCIPMNETELVEVSGYPSLSTVLARFMAQAKLCALTVCTLRAMSCSSLSDST